MVQVGDVKRFTDIGGMHIPHLTGDEPSKTACPRGAEDLWRTLDLIERRLYSRVNHRSECKRGRASAPWATGCGCGAARRRAGAASTPSIDGDHGGVARQALRFTATPSKAHRQHGRAYCLNDSDNRHLPASSLNGAMGHLMPYAVQQDRHPGVEAWHAMDHALWAKRNHDIMAPQSSH